jgi:hypothetical protein
MLALFILFYIFIFVQGCLTQVARDAHGDHNRVTASGISCGFVECKTRLGRDVMHKLLEVGARTLPDQRATHGDPPQPIFPLTGDEVKLEIQMKTEYFFEI